jgi:DNA-binding CsgD family transcriptional regulator/tetratricopeptide (TPR) repeat protein
VAADNKSITSPILIGRARQFDSIIQRLEEVNLYKGTVILISGDAGIGKSRLVNETKKYVIGKELIILQGNCSEPDRALPYAPFLDLLRTFIITLSPDQINQEFGSTATEMVQLIPELANVLPNLSYSATSNPDIEKHRIFQALTQFFVSRLSKINDQSGLLLVIEDLHWSDVVSLEFLEHLVRRVESLPIALLLTYRTDETNPGLDKLLGALNRQRVALEIFLQSLTAKELDTMMRAIFEQDLPVRAEFLETIFALTEGNPFFTEEILKSLVAAGGLFYKNGVWDNKPIRELKIPHSIQDAVHRRTLQLSPKAQEILTLAAVAGRRFDFGLLQILTKMNEADLLEQMKELVAAQLFVEETADQFAFRHALTREATYTRLLLRERRKYHAVIAETIENIYVNRLDVHVTDLSYHFYEAGVWEKTIEYSQQAGERALALYAPREAIIYFIRAIEATQRSGITPSLKLLRGRGQAYETIGDFENALADYEVVLKYARNSQDIRTERQGLIDLGFLWAGRDYQQTGEFFHSASELAETMGDPKLLASSLNRLGNWLANIGECDQAKQIHERALEICQAQGDQAGAAETFDLLGMLDITAGDFVESDHYYQQSIQLFRELGDKRGLVSSLIAGSHGTFLDETIILPLRPIAEHQRGNAEALSLAQEIDWPSGMAFAEWAAGISMAGVGEFGLALHHGQQALRVATQSGHKQWIAGAHYTLGHIYNLIFQPDLALRNLELGFPLALELASSWWIGNITAFLALAFLLKQDLAQAEAVLQRVMEPNGSARNLPERRMRWAWAKVALAKGRPQQALKISDELLESVPGTDKSQFIPALLKLKADALIALNQVSIAQRVLENALLGAEQRNARPLLWEIHATIGHLHQLQKERELANIEYSKAREIAQSMANTIEDPSLQADYLYATVETLPPEKIKTTRQIEKGKFGGLTTREREIATLIRDGKSNREIADALFVSERTIEGHVGNILARLGYTSRSQIAAWAVEKGLAKLR